MRVGEREGVRVGEREGDKQEFLIEHVSHNCCLALTTMAHETPASHEYLKSTILIVSILMEDISCHLE